MLNCYASERLILVGSQRGTVTIYLKYNVAWWFTMFSNKIDIKSVACENSCLFKNNRNISLIWLLWWRLGYVHNIDINLISSFYQRHSYIISTITTIPHLNMIQPKHRNFAVNILIMWSTGLTLRLYQFIQMLFVW